MHCPQLDELNELLTGLSLWEAKNIAKDLGFRIKVTIDNGVHLGEGYFCYNRINVEMEEHKVKRVLKIG